MFTATRRSDDGSLFKNMLPSPECSPVESRNPHRIQNMSRLLFVSMIDKA